MGLGAGGFWDAIEGMGGPRRSPAAAVESLAEAIDVVRLVWSGERNLRFSGRHYSLKGIHSGPVPAHDIGIWVGAAGPRMLSLIGEKADGWVPSSGWLQLDRVPEMHDRIDRAAAGAGRKPTDIRRILNVGGVITEGDRGDYLVGPTSYWVEELTRLAVELGMDTFVFWPGTDAVPQLHRFIEDVAPAVRDGIAARRN